MHTLEVKLEVVGFMANNDKMLIIPASLRFNWLLLPLGDLSKDGCSKGTEGFEL